MRAAVEAQRRRSAAARVSLREQVLRLAGVFGVAVRLVLDVLAAAALAFAPALYAAICIPDTGAQAAEDLAVLGPPFPDPGPASIGWLLRGSP